LGLRHRNNQKPQIHFEPESPEATCQTQNKRKASGECQTHYFSLFFSFGLRELLKIATLHVQ